MGMHFIALQMVTGTPLWPLLDLAKSEPEDKVKVMYYLNIYNWIWSGSEKSVAYHNLTSLICLSLKLYQDNLLSYSKVMSQS